MVEQKKVLMIVCDGMGDRPVEELGWKTPLQYANTPNLDHFASKGVCGIMDTIRQGVTPGSDTAHLALFGYDPFKVYNGRGPFEVAGSGMDLQPGDVAFRCNFSTVDRDLVVTDRRAGRIKTGTLELEQAINGTTIDGVEFIFKATQEHRGVLVMRGEGLSAGISDVDPHHLGPILECKARDDASKKTADLLNQYVKKTYELMDGHPVNTERREQGKPAANIVLPRGAGSAGNLRPLNETYDVSFGGIAGVALVRGVLRLIGAECIDVPGATGGADSDFDAKMKAGVDGLAKHDMMFINMKAPDLFGHDGDHLGKVGIIEKIDSAFGYARENLPSDALLTISADHSTPTTVMDHSADPVPLCIYGTGVRTDPVQHYNEIELAQGGLGRIVGQNLLAIVQDLANRREKFGA